MAKTNKTAGKYPFANKYVTVVFEYKSNGEYSGKYNVKTPEAGGKYYGEVVYADDDWFSKAVETLAKEGFKLLEIHSINALNRTENCDMAGTPVPGFGNNNWGRIIVEKDGKVSISSWVFRYGLSSAASFARRGANRCANCLVNANAFRPALLASLGPWEKTGNKKRAASAFFSE